jgi:hypothetical protein
MLNNPNIQPNTTINRWIAGILLFDFKLVHIPGATHGPDGLSRRLAQPDNPPEPEDDYEDWINQAYRFMHIINPTTINQGSHLVLSLFTLTNTEAPANSFSQPLTTNFVHCNQAVLTDIVNATPDFTPLIITDPTKEHIPHDDHQNKAGLKLNLVVALLQDTYCGVRVSMATTKSSSHWCGTFHSSHRCTITSATMGFTLCEAT